MRHIYPGLGVEICIEYLTRLRRWKYTISDLLEAPSL